VKYIKYLITLLFIVYIGSAIQAQQRSFSVDISSDSILLGNYIEVSYTAVNIEGEFVGPSMEGFTVIGGPNSSSSMSSINGDVRRQMSYSYYLEPTDIGEYVIPPAYINSSDQWETEPMKIRVYPNPDGIIERPMSEKQGFNFNFNDFFGGDSPFGQDSPFGEEKEDETKSKKKKAKRRKI